MAVAPKALVAVLRAWNSMLLVPLDSVWPVHEIAVEPLLTVIAVQVVPPSIEP